MMRFFKLIPVALAILATFWLVTAQGQEANSATSTVQKEPAYDIVPLYQEVRRLARKYYPEVTAHHLSGEIHFEQDTRIFIVHEQLKTGEWQDPWGERGPKPGGIHCDIRIQRGAWQGAAVVPASDDKRYFISYLMAPYSKELDAHLYVLVKYPRNVPDGFLRELTDTLNNFDKLVKSGTTIPK